MANKETLQKPFIDERGMIQNLITTGVGSVAIIATKKDGVRSNHYHKNNSHHLYIVSGSIKYFERDLDGSNVKDFIVNAGEMVYTPSQKVHKVLALEDCVMISLAPESNEHSAHEEDVIRIEF